MTIATQTSSVTAQGNGATTVWPFSFIIPTGALIVTVTNRATSVAEVIDSADYSVSGLDDPAGGSVTYPLSGSPLSSSYNITIARDVEFVQETELENQGGFFPEVIEEALDYLTMQTQQLLATVDRAVLVPVGSTIDPVDYLATVQESATEAAADAAAAAVSAAAAAASATEAQTAVGTTYLGGTSTGSGNAQAVATVSPSGFVLTAGYRVIFTAGFANTGATTFAIGGTAATAVRKRTPAGLVALEGGEIVSGFLVDATFDGTYWNLNTNYLMISAPGVLTNLASAATTDLGTVPSRNINITGTTTITALGSSANTNNPLYMTTFAGALTLTHNATSLILPGGRNITTAAGDKALWEYLGSGNWRCINYMKANGAPVLVSAVAAVFKNLVVQATSNTQVTVTADALIVEDTNGIGLRLSTVNVTAAITSSGANGLDTGAEASSTWYSVWVIYNPATNTMAALLSTSTTSPTMPSGYTYKVRVGWVRNDGSSNFWRTIQFGCQAQIIIGTNPTELPQMITGASGSTSIPTWTAVAVGNFVPPTACKISVIAVQPNGGPDGQTLIAPNNSYGSRSSTTNPPPLMVFRDSGVTQSAGSAIGVMLLETTNIYYAAGGTGARALLFGWEDNL